MPRLEINVRREEELRFSVANHQLTNLEIDGHLLASGCFSDLVGNCTKTDEYAVLRKAFRASTINNIVDGII